MSDPIDKINAGLGVADHALTLAARLAELFKPDSRRKAARLRAKAGRLNAASLTAKPRRAAKLRARAADLVEAAHDLDPFTPGDTQ